MNIYFFIEILSAILLLFIIILYVDINIFKESILMAKYIAIQKNIR